MTDRAPDRQCKAKPTNLSRLYIMVAFIAMWTFGHTFDLITIKSQLEEISETLAASTPPTPGRQQGVSTPDCPPVEGQSGEPQGEHGQQVRVGHGPLAQQAEQRTFNPQSTHNPYQPEAKLTGFSRDSGATSAPGCARLHADRVSGGCQEGETPP